MKLLEIKNNLVKMSYADDDILALGQFIALVDNNSSYVGQIVNLKADAAVNFAVARLIFVFNNEGIVNSYDGTIPSIKANLVKLGAKDILNLLPVEKPVVLGQLAQQETVLKIDSSIFEKNLVICAEKFDNIFTITKNCTSQLEKLNEKSVIIDVDHTFGEYEPVRFKRDFRLPLNAEMIDYIYENDMTETDAAGKAVIQDILYEVQEYTKTLEYGFIPFNTFLNVVAEQYRQTNIPELALLKNKLLKYQEANVFAQAKEDLVGLKQAVEQNTTTYIDIADVPDGLQKHLITYIHTVLDEINSYIYVFVKLTNKNSGKKLLSRIFNNNHIFTTIICSHNYKYIAEIKQRAENIILFAPQTVQHDFALYNTFLNKLNANEFIIFGDLTQNVPFIVELSEFLDDEELTEEPAEDIPELPEETLTGNTEELPKEELPATVNTEEIQTEYEEPDSSYEILDEFETAEEIIPTHDELVEQAAKDIDEMLYTKPEEIPSIEEITQDENENLTEDDLDYIDDLTVEEDEVILEEEPIELTPDYEPEKTEETAEPSEELNEPQPPVVPIYPAETPVLSEDAPVFEQGDIVNHPKHGKGVIEKLIKYGNKTLCSISFENVGRRLLDPAISELTKSE